MATWIKGADWVVAWDETHGRHAYLRDGDVVFDGETIGFVGRDYSGTAEAVVDGRGLCVLPGLVDIHSHPNSEPAYRGIREEHGRPRMYMTGLYERSLAFVPDQDGLLACAEAAYCELLQSGVTTIADLSSPYPGWLDLLAKSGLRGVVAPGYASSRWLLENDFELKFVWDEAAGRRGLDESLRLMAQADQHPCGRLSGMLYPAQIETCTADLFRDSIAAARQQNRPMTTHLSQSVLEFQEIVRRHGKTPMQYAQELGILGPNTILGHAIFIDEHSWLHWSSREDLAILARSGTTVAHCPTPFARYGQVLEDFGRYLRAGVRMGIGTDCAPHNMLEEMGRAAVLARIAAGDITTVSTADIFHAATVGGAAALLRDDLGRLAPGMKADLVLIDLAHPLMQPLYDPLRNLVYTAAERAVRDVYVGGKRVVAEGVVLGLDHKDALGRLQQAQERMIQDVPSHDYARRRAEEIVPLSLPFM
ncbi:MAG: amidohydrolase family protein [Kiloniellales bacterium]